MNNPFTNEIKSFFNNGTALTRIIIVNAIIFIAVFLFGLLLWFFNIGNGSDLIASFFTLPADLNQLIYKPWSLISYMFLHQSLMHVLFNMLVLYFGGRIFLQFLSEKKLTSVYFLGGLSGGLLYILAFNVFPVFSDVLPHAQALGASASVMAILVAAATNTPNFKVQLILFGEVKIKYIAIAYIVLDVISIPQNNAGGHIAHLGGAIFGYFYITQLKKGNNIASFFEKLITKSTNIFKSKSKIKVVHRKTKSNYEFNAQKKAKQDQIDAILDKISKSGYDSLTAKEKHDLFNAGK